VQDTIIFEFDYFPDEMPVERDAKIFEAGEYPDKEISVSEEDLDTIVSNFAEIPVKVEHMDSPLDPLGTVKRIWRRGKELFARLAFPRDLAAFLERRGIKKLSVALHKDPLRLAEVSLVLSPRVPSAAMFGSSGAEVPALAPVPSPNFGRGASEGRGEGKLPNPQSEIRSQKSVPPTAGSRQRRENPKLREEVSKSMSASEIEQTERDAEIAELRFALRARDMEARLADFKAQGKIVPASEPYAREILLKGDGKVTFGDGEATIAQLFECFLEAQPKVITFGELAPSVRRSLGEGGSGAPLSADEEELLAKLGITREQVEKYAG